MTLWVKHLIDTSPAASRTPCRDAPSMRPHHDSRLWAWTHFGSFIPDLPAPLRYLNTMTFIGNTGVRAFDNGEITAPDARRNATVLSSTAHDDMHFYRSFDTDTECRFDASGRRLEWGENLTWVAGHPRYAITGRYGTFDVDLILTAYDQVSYFIYTPIYQHFSLLAAYSGTVTHRGIRTDVGGLGTVEYGRCLSPQSLSRRPMPPRLRLPVDFFTYQIIDLDAATQLLLTEVRLTGATLTRTVHVRSTTAGRADIIDRGVTFAVTSHQPVPGVDPAGRRMRLPRTLEWTIPGHGHIRGTVDSPMRYGHGLGYVGCYSFQGEWLGRQVDGTGYLEWIDLLSEPAPAVIHQDADVTDGRDR